MYFTSSCISAIFIRFQFLFFFLFASLVNLLFSFYFCVSFFYRIIDNCFALLFLLYTNCFIYAMLTIDQLYTKCVFTFIGHLQRKTCDSVSIHRHRMESSTRKRTASVLVNERASTN